MPPRTSRTVTRRVAPATPQMEEQTVVPTATHRSLWPVVAVLGMLFLIAASVAGYFYYQYRQTAAVVDAKEIEDLSQEISQFMILPSGETPTLATVTDREKLAEQPFFQKAENGDKVLIFSQSGRAILYRPSQKKIVDVTTVNVNQATTTQEAPAVPSAPEVSTVETMPSIVRVALYNGSTTVGVTNTVENQLKQVSSAVAVVTKENAKKNDYERTMVVDVTGKNTEMANKIASTLGGTVASLPDGEVTPPDADIVVIVGKNGQ